MIPRVVGSYQLLSFFSPIHFFPHQEIDLSCVGQPDGPTAGKRLFKHHALTHAQRDALGAQKAEEPGNRMPHWVTSWLQHYAWLSRKHMLPATTMNAKKRVHSLPRQSSKAMQGKNKDPALQNDFLGGGQDPSLLPKSFLKVNLSLTDILPQSSMFLLLWITQRWKRKLML